METKNPKVASLPSLTKVADDLIAHGGEFEKICAALAAAAKVRKITTATDRKYVLGIIKWRKKYQPLYAHYYDALEITDTELKWKTPPPAIEKAPKVETEAKK
jgi:hypothetical protein